MTLEKPLVRNRKLITLKDFATLGSMAAPALFFGAGLILAYLRDNRFAWLAHLSGYPWELWVLAAAGTIATAGGLGDWIFHRVFVTVGPREHRSHLLALASGGVPLFGLMAAASVIDRPAVLLVPILVVVLYTAVLICFDEFVFHRVRCTRFETLLHRLLVFGNGVAWLAWMNWCFVRGGIGAGAGKLLFATTGG
jgi:hypothetical protein